MTVNLPSMLSLESLASALAAESEHQDAAAWGRPLHIDMSYVEYADFGTLAQVLLMVDGAAAAGTEIRLDLPRPSLFEGEEVTPFALGGAAKRALCLEFLKAAGFVAAALLPHRSEANVQIVSPDDQGFDAALVPKLVGDTARIVTFRWLSPAVGEQLWRSDGLVALIRSLRSIGLPNWDAQSLANAVLFELIENVGAHAGDRLEDAPHALVGAIAVDPDRTPPRESVPAEILPFAVWSAGSLTIRIVVGDSGRGLVDHLQPHAPERPNLDISEADDTWSRAEGVAFWALERWSTSSLDPGARRGARGLWRVLRAVRSYAGGSLLVQTRDAAVGYSFMPDHADPVRIAVRLPTKGTLVDVRLIPVQVPALTPVVAPSYANTGTAHADFRWLRLGGGRPDDEVFAEARELVRYHCNILFTLDGGPTHHLGHERLAKAMEVASELANPAVIAMVVTGVDAITIEDGIDALHHPWSDGENPGADPFLLIDGSGAVRWCGGTPDVRSLLHQLLRGPLSWNDRHEQDGQAARLLVADQPHLVQRSGEDVELIIHPSYIVSVLDKLATTMIDEAVHGGGPGVYLGTYRTPNLGLTDRWVETDELVENTTGPGIAAFLLAQKLLRAIPNAAQSDVLVGQVTASIEDVAKLLAESLRLHRPVHQMLDDAAVPTTLEPLSSGTKVLLCADVLLTGNNTIYKIKEVCGWNGVPVAAVAVVDAREEGAGGPLSVAGLDVPVIALASFAPFLASVDDESIVDMDPVMRVPLQRAQPPRRQYAWGHDDFLKRGTELPWLIMLGHVVRPAGRHFTAYLDANRLVDPGSRIHDEMKSGMMDAILSWRGSGGADNHMAQPPVFIHAGTQDGFARRFAALLSRGVSQALGLPEIRPTPVSRAIAGSRYAFPDAISLPAESDVVLVDWGSFDATTLLQLIRLAAEGGARRIFAIVLLSQLSEHDERALTMMTSVSGIPGGKPVSTKLEFWTTIGITPLARSECTLCRMVQSLRERAQFGNLPRELALYAESLADSLAPLAREQLTERTVDAFGARATTEDALEYVRLRKLLILALRSTAYADKAARQIAAMTKTPHDRRAYALIRLLAAEQQWLHLRPVRLVRCQEDISKIALAVATERRADERMRIQAVVVLANSAQGTMAEHLDVLWRSALHNKELLQHIFLELWNMLTSHRERAAAWLSGLRHKIRDCRQIPPAEYGSAEQAEDMQYLAAELQSALDLWEAPPASLAPKEAWARLREGYLFRMARHPDAETAIVNMQLMLEDLPAEGEALSLTDWEMIRRSWVEVSSFLEEHVLSFSPSLGSVLGGAFAQERFSPIQRERIHRFTSHRGLDEIAALGSRIGVLKKGRGGDRQFHDAWHEIRRRLEGWNKTVLSSGGDTTRRAELVEFLDTCPADTLAVIEHCMDLSLRGKQPVSINVENRAETDIKVFVPQDLLRNAIQHIIGNTVKASHRLPEFVNSVVDLHIELNTTATEAIVKFRNTGTRRTTATGKGISSMRRKLEDFGASITPLTPSSGWTYEIELVLDRW